MNIVKQLFKRNDEPKDMDNPPAYEPPVADTKIRMRVSCTGSSNGIKTQLFQANQTYTVSKRLAHLLCDELKAAERVGR